MWPFCKHKANLYSWQPIKNIEKAKSKYVALFNTKTLHGTIECLSILCSHDAKEIIGERFDIFVELPEFKQTFFEEKQYET